MREHFPSKNQVLAIAATAASLGAVGCGGNKPNTTNPDFYDVIEMDERARAQDEMDISASLGTSAMNIAEKAFHSKNLNNLDRHTGITSYSDGTRLDTEDISDSYTGVPGTLKITLECAGPSVVAQTNMVTLRTRSKPVIYGQGSAKVKRKNPICDDGKITPSDFRTINKGNKRY